MNDVLKNPLTAACMKRTAERKVIKLKKKNSSLFTLILCNVLDFFFFYMP